ncbi:AAA family ATPase [Alcanivorax sp.]|uniref:ParA family protein n=1 Tax=Alcanivorax sp. TaxID=1872427 RepID=UPI000C590DD2|nr:AAA family ATPase [Alcanivorax sp.]MBQ24653.1 chromosome partitioning protein ParA [Alcanivorax sp.]|tara:strand:- start:1403 stop:2149 length:747 start_codon:yes stop_codon:yes gene_type:complete
MQTIAFYNLKGGVGKTTTAVNVAWHAARWKHRTLLWDLDPQGAASFYLGVDDGDGYKAANLIKGKQPIGRLKRETRWANLDAIPADLSMRNADIKLIENGGAKNRLKQLIAPLGESYELVILDCPPTLSPLAESIFAAVDYLFVPVIPTHLSVRAFQQVMDWLDSKNYKNLTVVPFFNMVDRHRDLHVEMLVKRPKVMKGGLKGWIPYSTHVEQMGDHRAPVGEFAPYTPSAQAFRAMWFEIAGKLKL